ncbi:TRAP transporter small permease [Dehalococcoidia bacterium]|nr:TRAP transporter small permease [Dehalococcoidia bacterium]
MPSNVRGAKVIIDCLHSGAGAGAGLALLAMGFITFYEVVVREMGAPTVWAFHVVEYMQICLVFLGLPFAQRAGKHAVIDIIEKKLALKARLWMHIVSSILCLVVSCLFLWGSWSMVWGSYSGGTMTTGFIRHQLFYIQIPPLIGGLLLVLVFLQQIAGDMKTIHGQ